MADSCWFSRKITATHGSIGKYWICRTVFSGGLPNVGEEITKSYYGDYKEKHVSLEDPTTCDINTVCFMSTHAFQTVTLYMNIRAYAVTALSHTRVFFRKRTCEWGKMCTQEWNAWYIIVYSPDKICQLSVWFSAWDTSWWLSATSVFRRFSCFALLIFLLIVFTKIQSSFLPLFPHKLV